MKLNLRKFLLISLTLIPFFHLSAQESASAGILTKVNSLPADIFVLLVIILAELIIILFLASTLLQYLSYKIGVTSPQYNQATKKAPSWFQRLNKTVALEDEESLDLKHDYDGIRELDNKTPTWWSYAFYGTILFAIVYLYQVFISGSMPTQAEELKKEYAQAQIVNSQVLSTASNNVDENNVTMLDATSINNGAMIFKANCVVCHGEHGEGNTVGPNLTDQYWIHKGGIKDIFKTIKYGFPDKGMKGWQDDFSPVQLAEISSYVKSLVGSKPTNGKERQGDFYMDSTAATSISDTTKL